MLQPLSVFKQVQEGHISARWFVFRPRRIELHLILVTEIFSGGMTLLTTESTLNDEAFGKIITSPIIQLLVSLVAASVAMVIAFGIVVLVKRSRDAVLILLPEGVVQCERCSDETKRSFHVIDYAKVATIRLQTRSTRYEVLFSLHIQYREGQHKTWKIQNKFRSPEWIAQRIITDHECYISPHRSFT